MLLRIQKYNAQVVYVPGRSIPLADALSPISPCPGDTIPGLDVSIHELNLHLNTSCTRLEQIKLKTAKDEDLASLKRIIYEGWPDTCILSDELTIADGIILMDLGP